jgi:hypothetical protein
MRKAIIILILLAFTLMTTAVTFAQDNIDDYNPCLNGTWYCPDPDNPAREEWNWGAAWYWALYFAGEITFPEIPEWVRGPLYPPGSCQVALVRQSYDGIHSGGYDIWLPGDIVWESWKYLGWVPSSPELPSCPAAV